MRRENEKRPNASPAPRPRAGMELVLPSMVEGDLVFFEPIEPNFSVQGQRLLRFWRGQWARHSHVAVGFAPGLVVHSTPHGGVHIETLRNLILSRPKDIVTVLRNSQIAENEKARKAIHDQLLFHVDKNYNFTITLRSRSPALFCSELAGMVYAKQGYSFGKVPWQTLPVDLAEGAKHWTDVTERAIQWYRADTTDPVERGLIALAGNDAHARVLKQMQELALSSSRDAACMTELPKAMNVLLRTVGMNEFELEDLSGLLAGNWTTAGPKVIVPKRRKSRRKD